ncbi:MAG TPA: hypothetical protein VLC48_05090, partial [Gemmatimonadota bacterium]|nr:hypothetical protein [Gemmatimonadota bacterium]
MDSQLYANSNKRFEALLWVVAAVLMVATAYYQRKTGPSYPVRGSFQLASQEYRYSLPRNALTTSAATVGVPGPGGVEGGALHYRRYRTDDEFETAPLRGRDGELVGELPAQPPAGKLEYLVTLDTPEGELLLPSSGETVIIRFKDPVPLYYLIPHIAMMFVAMLIGVRAGLAGIFGSGKMRQLAWISLAVMTVGGLILGPIAQYYAFGAFWTGFPVDYDLTDNKVLIMWLVWVLACATIVLAKKRNERAS